MSFDFDRVAHGLRAREVLGAQRYPTAGQHTFETSESDSRLVSMPSNPLLLGAIAPRAARDAAPTPNANWYTIVKVETPAGARFPRYDVDAFATKEEAAAVSIWKQLEAAGATPASHPDSHTPFTNANATEHHSSITRTDFKALILRESAIEVPLPSANASPGAHDDLLSRRIVPIMVETQPGVFARTVNATITAIVGPDHSESSLCLRVGF